MNNSTFRATLVMVIWCGICNFFDAAGFILSGIAPTEALSAAIAQLGVLRMRKYEVKAAETLADAEAIATQVLAAIAAVGE